TCSFLLPTMLASNPQARGVSHGRGGCRASVHQHLSHWIYANVQALERARAEEREIARLTEHDLIDRPQAVDVQRHAAGPSTQDGSVGLPEMPYLLLLDA